MICVAQDVHRESLVDMLSAMVNLVRTQLKQEYATPHSDSQPSPQDSADRSFEVFSKLQTTTIVDAVAYLGQVKDPMHGNEILLKGRLLRSAILAAKRFLCLMLWCVILLAHLFVVVRLTY